MTDERALVCKREWPVLGHPPQEQKSAVKIKQKLSPEFSHTSFESASPASARETFTCRLRQRSALRYQRCPAAQHRQPRAPAHTDPVSYMTGKDRGLICFHPPAQSSSARCKTGILWLKEPSRREEQLSCGEGRGRVGLGQHTGPAPSPHMSQPLPPPPPSRVPPALRSAVGEEQPHPRSTKRGLFCTPETSCYQDTIHVPSPGFNSFLPTAEAGCLPPHPPPPPRGVLSRRVRC